MDPFVSDFRSIELSFFSFYPSTARQGDSTLFFSLLNALNWAASNWISRSRVLSDTFSFLFLFSNKKSKINRPSPFSLSNLIDPRRGGGCNAWMDGRGPNFIYVFWLRTRTTRNIMRKRKEIKRNLLLPWEWIAICNSSQYIKGRGGGGNNSLKESLLNTRSETSGKETDPMTLSAKFFFFIIFMFCVGVTCSCLRHSTDGWSLSSQSYYFPLFSFCSKLFRAWTDIKAYEAQPSS